MEYGCCLILRSTVKKQFQSINLYLLLVIGIARSAVRRRSQGRMMIENNWYQEIGEYHSTSLLKMRKVISFRFGHEMQITDAINLQQSNVVSNIPQRRPTIAQEIMEFM